MDQSLLQKVNREIYRKYPEFDGVNPVVQSSPVAQFSGKEQVYALTYHRIVVISNNRRMERVLRVSVSAQGKIQKVSTSHS